MSDSHHLSSNRVLVVDDDAQVIGEYLRCLGKDFEPDATTATLGDLEKVLLGEESNDKDAARFEVHSRNQGKAAVDAVKVAIDEGAPFSIVFVDIEMPPGMDGIETAKQNRAQDATVNIVLETALKSVYPENLCR